LYDALLHRLVSVASGDHRAACGTQAFVAQAGLNLMYVANFSSKIKLPDFAANASMDVKLQWAYIAAGSQSQNVNLYCASEGLGAIDRASIPVEVFAKLALLTIDQKILLAQTVGYRK
jgi:hypothetical protein